MKMLRLLQLTPAQADHNRAPPFPPFGMQQAAELLSTLVIPLPTLAPLYALYTSAHVESRTSSTPEAETHFGTVRT